MAEVTIRELRNHGSTVLERVERGEVLTVTRDGRPMIAAIALANDLPVYTCNPQDFDGIEGLEVVAIPVPAPA